MRQQTIATPKEEINLAMLADQIWNEVCEFCINNIDRQIVSTGVNAANNLRYGRYYGTLADPKALVPDIPLNDLNLFNKFAGNNVYFIRSSDLPTAKQLPYFTVCICFINNATQHIKVNGTFSISIGGHPTVSIFVDNLLRTPANYLKVIEAFKFIRESGGQGERSTFMHEFTHMLDNQKYSLSDTYSKRKPEGPVEYVNLTHEINARYLQIVHNIIDRLAQMDVLSDFHTHFPTFQSFYSHYWSAKSGAIPPQLLEYLTPQNKKRLQTRLYGFYRYLIEQEIKNKIDKEQAVQYAQQQIIAD